MSLQRHGGPAKADPEEMFVASLSSCHMLWFLALARAERLRVTSYEDEPEGVMDDRRFLRVLLRATLTLWSWPRLLLFRRAKVHRAFDRDDELSATTETV
jgi:hypothetical protein